MTPEEALREIAGAGEEDLGRLLLRAFRAVNTQAVARLTALGHEGVRAGHAVVFTGLDPGGTRVSVLAERADMTRQGMSVLVRELQAAGYVDVEPDPSDGRASRVLLTPRGVAFCHEAAQAVRDVEAEWGRLLGADGLHQLRHALRLLAQPAATR